MSTPTTTRRDMKDWILLAARWARPRVDTTQPPRWCTQLLSPVTARLRWRSLGSSLALTCDLRMFSPLHWATPTPSTSRSAPRITRHEAKLAHYGPHLPSLVRQNISYTPIVWSACGRPHRDTLTVLRSLSKSIARKRNFVSAEVVYQKLHASITLEIWKRSARQIRACWALAALPVSRTQNHSSCPGLSPVLVSSLASSLPFLFSGLCLL